MELLDQIECNKSDNDVINRRLKNRERQRRYRARKRLEAHINTASVVKVSAQVPEENQLNRNFTNCTTMVHCRRNWKKDARLAHALKGQAITSLSPVICAPIASENLKSHLQIGSKAEASLENEYCTENPSGLDNLVTTRTTHRRDWKAEARNKKS